MSKKNGPIIFALKNLVFGGLICFEWFPKKYNPLILFSVNLSSQQTLYSKFLLILEIE